MPAEQRERPVVGRRLDEHRVAAREQRPAEQVDQLERAVAHQHAIHWHAVLGGQPLAKRPEAGARPVLLDEHAVRPGDDRGGTLGELGEREALVGGYAAGEVDGTIAGRHGHGGPASTGSRRAPRPLVRAGRPRL